MRVKAEKGRGSSITVWVTKVDPPDDFDIRKAATASTTGLISVMSSVKPPVLGTCILEPADPLPPQDKYAPDDTP
ncbi:hypothetical protein [Segeticoccus rhizosphaerae]|uniref:hypothetical protein n=1 Tax=Segeticoccus rhizosphaerae TaxID=1104777 RepID=UPI0012659DBF|nr:hypothetical protein [Segeticoccus rhizosphaerae]